MSSDRCPVYAPFFGTMGCAFSIVLTSFGAAYGTAKSGVGITASSVMKPEQGIRNMIPVVMSGILAIYGVVVSVMISTSLKEELSLYRAFIQLGAGLSTGLSGLAAGFAIGIVGDAGVRACAVQPRAYAGMALILIFSEVLGLYGLVISLIMLSQQGEREC